MVTLIVLTAVFSLLVLLRWPTDGRVDLSGARSQQVFLVFAYALLAGVLFVIPAFPAVAFVQEKNSGTLALLINSPLSALSIYCGKLLGSLGFSAMLLLTSVPAAAACYAMGGLELFGQVGMIFIVLGACTLQYTVIALFVSTRTQSSDAAVRVTYGIVFAVSVLAVGPYYLLQGQSGLLSTLSWWLRAASPLPVLMRLVGHGELGEIGIGQVSTTMAYFMICVLSSVVLGALTVMRLNHRLFDQAKSQGTITDDLSLFARIARRFLYLVDPQRRKSGIPFYANPVTVKEFRTRKFGRIHWLLRLVSVCAVLSLLLTFCAAASIVDWGVETIGGFMVLLQIALVVLITPSLTSGLISTERESGGWELMRMTPMSPLRIVSGKLLSVIWTVALILLATVPGYVVMIYIKPTMWLQVQNVLICLGLAAVYTISIGAFVGSLFRRTAAATTTCYAVLIVLFLGPLLIWMAQDAPFSHEVVEAALTINPTGAALSIIEFQLSESKHFRTYELLPTAWWVASIVSAGALCCFGFQVWRICRPL
ncbi:MAG: ABC transporter [Planctomycetaceae bacterium]|nr:ABC transporter [Planctomycetaceae bacterium]